MTWLYNIGVAHIQDGAFVVAIILVAFITWIFRSLVESDPDPFLLNLTFFAFAGQCIRLGELATREGIRGIPAFLLVFGVLFVFLQVAIMRGHLQATRNHYIELLHSHKTEDCSESDITHWANTLLHITRVDFSPGKYWWLELFTSSDPRERRRKDAFSMLPSRHFKLAAPGFTGESLIVPDTKRKKLWNWYLLMCVASWFVFLLTMLIPQATK